MHTNITLITLSVTGFALLSAACGIVGFQYQYEGQSYTMTRENSDYHQAAIKDVRSRYGDPAAQEDVRNLKGACELLQKYAATAPDGGSFTPARSLLDSEARQTCQRWHAREATLETKAQIDRAHAENERQREAERQAREARDKQVEAEREQQERARVAAMLERDTRTVEICTATEVARAARRRHAEILDKAPGALVRKTCTPRMETQTVKAECKDANGFVRTCAKAVSTGEVASYVCPKTLDAEVVQLGLYQLHLLDDYPYPEDRSIRTSDSECEHARDRATQAKEKLERMAKGAAQ